MNKFDIAFDYVIENEKGLNTDPTDLGGITNFGISEKFIGSLEDDDQLPDYHIQSHAFIVVSKKIRCPTTEATISYIECLDLSKARWIYLKYFWATIYAQIENQDICNYIFDMVVQHGHHKAAELVQRACNAYWKSKEWLVIDRIFGKITLSSINRCASEDINRIESCLIAVRESLFRCIAIHDKTQEHKLESWLRRCYR